MHQKVHVAVLAVFAVVGASSLLHQSWTSAPTWDESAQLASGIAILRSGDPGFYRVNPPLVKLSSAAIPELLFQPELPGLYPASQMAVGARHEFNLGYRFMQANHADYRTLFYVGRLPRVLLTCLTAWLIVFLLPQNLRKIGLIAAILWLTNPLVLGHGWLIMPDVSSATMMVLLITSTVAWWRRPARSTSTLCGLAWGLALSTKFTFCAVYLAWPVGTVIYQTRVAKLKGSQATLTAIQSHIYQGCIAAIVVAVMYGGQDLGWRLSQHHFRSDLLSWLNDTSSGDAPSSAVSRLVGQLPSPLPAQFLIGIDEQQAAVENGRAAYVDGRWYPEGVWWYYVYGLLAKEQLAVWIGAVILAIVFAVSLIRRKRLPPTGELRDKDVSALLICCSVAATSVLLVLSLHWQMAVNLRYALPALPAIYLLAGVAWCHCSFRAVRAMRFAAVALCVVMLLEYAVVFPNYFAYVNPMLGGSYKTPPVLHQSNFDAGQDLWRLEKWLSRNRELGTERYLCIHSHEPEACFQFKLRDPDPQVLEQMIQSRETPQANANTGVIEIVLQRRLGWEKPPETQGRRYRDQLIVELLHYPPDEFVTPTIAIYRMTRPSG